MKRFHSLLLLLVVIQCCFTQLAFGQFTSGQLASAQQQTIKGALKDATAQKRVEYATVVLYNRADSTYIIGGVSDSIGSFSLQAPRGDYFLEVNHINYHRYYHGVGHISKDTLLASFNLSPQSLGLDEVVVVGTTPSVHMTPDKSNYKVSDIASAASGSLSDVLKNIPSLTFDFNETALINGIPTRFFVDNREVTSSELKAYIANQIATIEVISNPTAQYDADGLSGIVLLRTKRNRSTGFGGVLTTSGAHDMQTTSATLSYTQGKLSLSSALSYWNNYQHGAIKTATGGDVGSSTTSNTAYEMTQNAVKASVRNITGNLSVDYQLNEQSSASVSYQYIDFGYQSKDVSAHRQGSSDMRGITHQFAAAFNHNLQRPGETLKAHLYYNESEPTTTTQLHYPATMQSDSPSVSAFHYPSTLLIDNPAFSQLTRCSTSPFYSPTTLSSHNDPTTNYQLANNNRHSSFVGTVDYYLPFTENAHLEAGVKNHTRKIEIDRWDDLAGVPTLAQFTMREHILAAFVQMNSRMNAFNVQFGLRAETNLSDQIDGSRKWDIFPNLSLDYALNANNQLKIGYTNRVNRPSAADLNPFLLLIDPTSLFQGNPNLKPEYSHNFFVEYINRYELNDLRLSLYYKRVNNLITKTFERTEKGVLY